MTIFNCEVFEQTCSICFGNGSRFGCGNCYKTADKTGDPTCRLETQCNSSQTFLNNSLPCPDPTILNVSYTNRPRIKAIQTKLKCVDQKPPLSMSNTKTCVLIHLQSQVKFYELFLELMNKAPCLEIDFYT